MTINSKTLIAIIAVIIIEIGLSLFGMFSVFFQDQFVIEGIDQSSISGLSMLLYIIILVFLKLYPEIMGITM